MSTGTVFALDHKKNGLHAEAREIDGDFVLLKGSRTVAQWKQTSTKDQGYAKLHQKLIADGALQPAPDSEGLILTEDVAFSSPSAAGAVVVGRSANLIALRGASRVRRRRMPLGKKNRSLAG